MRGQTPAKSACVQTFSQQTDFNLLHSQHLLASVVHHYDRQGRGRGSRLQRSYGLPYVMDGNSQESPNGSNLKLTSSSHGLPGPHLATSDLCCQILQCINRTRTCFLLHSYLYDCYLILGKQFEIFAALGCGNSSILKYSTRTRLPCLLFFLAALSWGFSLLVTTQYLTMKIKS